MDKQKRNIAIGGVLGVLAIIVIYLNFFSGGGSAATGEGDSDMQKAIDSGSVAESQPTTPPPAENVIIKSGGGSGGTARINP